MEFMSLTILLILPLIGTLIIAGPWFPNHEVKIRRFAKGFAGFTFIYSLFFLIFFDPANKGYQFSQEILFSGKKWIEPIGAGFSLAVDGISILLVVLTTFIVLLACIASKSNIRHKHKLYYSMLFILTTAVIGVFTAKDMFLF